MVCVCVLKYAREGGKRKDCETDQTWSYESRRGSWDRERKWTLEERKSGVYERKCHGVVCLGVFVFFIYLFIFLYCIPLTHSCMNVLCN